MSLGLAVVPANITTGASQTEDHGCSPAVGMLCSWPILRYDPIINSILLHCFRSFV